jgi:hypothetical protein
MRQAARSDRGKRLRRNRAGVQTVLERQTTEGDEVYIPIGLVVLVLIIILLIWLL